MHENSYNEYSALEDEVVIEINPIFIKIWKYIDNKPYIECLNITDRITTREAYLNP